MKVNLPCAMAVMALVPPCLAQGLTGAPIEDGTPVWDSVDDTARTTIAPPGSDSVTSVDGRATTDPAWSLLFSYDVYRRLAKGERFAVQYDQSADALVPLGPSDPLTAKARQAVNRAPVWLQKNLEDQFSRLASTTQQDKWADEVLNASEPYVDETAFLVAHISKDDLQSAGFNVQLVRDSAHYAYEVDPFLAYVEVVDYGSAGTGGDYYTTLRYQVELDGQVSTVLYPRESYYWWVLAPRGSDEFPAYIDPDATCSSGGTQAPPPNGVFWREWYFYGGTNRYGGQCDVDFDGAHDDPCPVMKDMLAGAAVLWRHLPNASGAANGAVGLVNEWIRQSIGPFGDRDGCRPVQPVTIYYWTDGNCGEWADVTVAAGRAALIPTEVTETRINDHVWNEFYDHQWGRWVQWEPVNNMIDSNYAGWWGGRIAAPHTYRGDGWGHTERTTQHGPSATLTVTVYDANHYPVDGAKVVLGSEWDTFPAYIQSTSQGHTDARGQVRFWVGDSRNYYVRVTTPWGTYPASGWSQVISNAQGGAAYEWSPPNFSGSVPRLSVTPDASSGTNDSRMIEAEWTVTEGLVHGDSIVSASLFYTKEHAGDLDVFIADQAGWDQFVAGSPFQAFTTAIDDPGRTTEFIPPEPVDYYVAWSNKASMDMAHVVRGAVRLYCNTGAVPPVANLAVSKDASAASLLDWEDVVGHNVSGYSVYRSINPADVAETKTDAELAPFLLANTVASDYRDAGLPGEGQAYCYTTRARSGAANGCP